MSCPICQKDAADRYRPFCSKRCADVDLGRWMTGGYAIASERDEDVEEAEQAMARLAETPSDDAADPAFQDAQKTRH
ncbi:DNA gyrase inhibitor YacG [Dinoroseobacter sp. S124A]|uniref:DNA gyrase inhibitor YacG n=1 Tax=Dinoroseobacter sp. S124A TaxID=3415128 RepID=UPI003C7B51CD